jgi:outer membrane protein assembly factor BamE (lipoprotein component of BamABCDE complex)
VKIKVTIEQKIKADIEGYHRLAEFYYTYLNTRSSNFAEARLADCILKIDELKQGLTAQNTADNSAPLDSKQAGHVYLMTFGEDSDEEGGECELPCK